MSKSHRFTRRAFLQTSAAAVAGIAGCTKNNNSPSASAEKKGPDIVPSSAVSNEKQPVPSERITLGFIGIGNQGSGHYGSILGNKDVQILAACDVRPEVRERCRQKAEEAYGKANDKGWRGLDTYIDFRELLARGDLDAVLIATPEHWHAIMAIEAARAGKDIYCEKPLSHTVREAREMVSAVRRYDRVFQTGSQQRSSAEFRTACELVRSGRIGKLERIFVNVGGTSAYTYLPEQPIPPGFDWDRWLGPAPWSPYNEERASGSYSGGWRLIRDYSGGMMCDWGAHHFDIAQWGLGMDDSGPVEVHAPGDKYPVLTYVYANGVPVHHFFGDGAKQLDVPTKKNPNGVLFCGSDGQVEVNRGYLKTYPDSIGKEPLGPSDVHLYNSRNHFGNFVDCIRTRKKPICDVEIGARTIMVCHLGNIAYWSGRSFKWDPKQETITDASELNSMLDLPKRGNWTA